MAALIQELRLSTLQARTRPVSEDDEYLLSKKSRLQRLKSDFVASAAAENLARLLAEKGDVSDLVQPLTEKTAALQRVDESWSKADEDVRQKSAEFVAKLRELLRCHEIWASPEQPPRDAKDADQLEELVKDLEREISVLEKECQDAQTHCRANASRLESLSEDIKTLETQEREMRRSIQIARDAEGPESENISLLASFTAVKRAIHEKLAAHRVTDVSLEGTTAISIMNGDAVISMRFTAGKLIDASVACESKAVKSAAAQYVKEAIEENDALHLMESIKERLIREDDLLSEIRLLDERGREDKVKFSISFNPSTRVVTILLEKKAIYARLKVPPTYPRDAIELVKLDKPESSRKLKHIEEQLRGIMEKGGKGQLLNHWLNGLFDLL
jgi:hypothetical protein